jgi:ribosomal protein S18 acetylase RimI-like enzyme
MELPIAAESYQPSPGALLRAANRAELMLAKMAGTETVLDGAVAIINASRPEVRMVNFAAELSMLPGSTADALLDAVLAHFAAENATCWKLYTPDGTWSDDLARAAAARGFVPQQSMLMKVRKQRAVTQANEKLQVIPARAAYGELRALNRVGAQYWTDDPALLDDLADTLVDHYDEPRLEGFLGRLDRKPVGIAAVVTLGQIGVITEVFTHPDYRGQHVASTLLSHVMDHCVRAQFEQVVLEVDPDNAAAIGLYESLGFAEVKRMTCYRRPTGQNSDE